MNRDRTVRDDAFPHLDRLGKLEKDVAQLKRDVERDRPTFVMRRNKGLAPWTVGAGAAIIGAILGASAVAAMGIRITSEAQVMVPPPPIASISAPPVVVAPSSPPVLTPLASASAAESAAPPPVPTPAVRARRPAGSASARPLEPTEIF